MLRKAEASSSGFSTDGIEYLVGNGTPGDEPASQHTGGASHGDGYGELTISPESSQYALYPSSISEHGNILDSDELTTQQSITAVDSEAGGLDISSTCGQPDKLSSGDLPCSLSGPIRAQGDTSRIKPPQCGS